MYLDHFGLAVNPFGLSPKLDFLYRSEAFEESLAHLIFGVDNSEAIVMITGAIGTGKTMALQAFMMDLNEGVEWALVTNTMVTPLELLKLILEDLGIEFPPGSDKSDLLILFKEFIVEASRRGRRVIIIIDEAQNMSREVLEEIRLLTNLGQGDLQPVQVILVGQPELEALVNRPDLAQLRQRIRVHYRLEPLSRREVEEYLDHRMAVAGCSEHIFRPEAIERIYEFSGGVPRLVNSLAGQGLLGAFVAGRKKITGEDIDPPEDVRVPAPAPRAVPAEPDRTAAPEPPARTDEDRAPGPEIPVAARRQHPRAVRRREGGRRGGLWAALAVLVLITAVWFLYQRGDLQGLIERFPSSSASGPGPGAVPTEAASPSPQAAAGPAGATQVEAAPVRTDPSPAQAGDGSADESVPALEAGDPGSRAAEPEAADPAAAAPDTQAAAPLASGRFYVMVASFRTLRFASELARDLEDRGFSTLIEDKTVQGESWQRVLIGPYPGRDEALAGRAEYVRLEGEGYYPVVDLDQEQGT